MFSLLPRHLISVGINYAGPENPSFETGNLDGWTVLSGDAFGTASVSAVSSYWGGPFNQVGKYFLWGFAESGDTAVGELRSTTFQASSTMSFLVGGGWDPINLYVGLIRETDGKLLFNQTGTNDEALIRIIWDTTAYAGENVYVIVVDSSNATSWGHINIDDIRTGCNALADGGLYFNILGQANQPVQGSVALSAAGIYAIDPIRPQFHYTPYQGWINDPCGLIQWQGDYHLMSQFNPVAPLWGPMHWSHAKSSDAVHWRELPVALYPPYPNNPSDTSGRYTGSALLDNHTGNLQVIFTDATDTALHPGALPEVVSTAISKDGVKFTLYSGNPIISAPPSGSPSGFRDPKVFWDTTDNTWKMVVGSGDENSGKVQLYVATGALNTELVSWEYVGVLYEGDGSTGTMWECPNFFPIDGKWALFYGGNGLGWYEVGTYNGITFNSEVRGLLDAGPDSYATQWFVDSAGRNLAITWMGNWATSKWPSRVNGWAGSQSVMRELFIREDGGLGSKIIEEVAYLETGHVTSLGLTKVDGAIILGTSNTARLQVSVDLTKTNTPAFTIQMFSSSAESVNLTYTMANQSLVLDTTQAGYGQAGTWDATIAKSSINVLALDILIDRSSLEIFAQDGTAMTATVFPRYQESKDIKIISDDGETVFNSIVLTRLGSAWT
ncbi:glycoside hydrolase family 32 protein [Oidiodendron maius Zn]|uniref:beta-fructofuranosidase n=1 Tax=Oidiodendron maius (strain Zn) TaxID=913774 RepID=A0A0C3GVL5_OIDMZ|nr:glycoside hydrolase family 32 protein [Oidiodendron maius Zn]